MVEWPTGTAKLGLMLRPFIKSAPGVEWPTARRVSHARVAVASLSSRSGTALASPTGRGSV